jgi:hypothetical protein
MKECKQKHHTTPPSRTNNIAQHHGTITHLLDLLHRLELFYGKQQTSRRKQQTSRRNEMRDIE